TVQMPVLSSIFQVLNTFFVGVNAKEQDLSSGQSNILLIVIGVILLILLSAAVFCFCIVGKDEKPSESKPKRRKKRNDEEKGEEEALDDGDIDDGDVDVGGDD
ncbi:hypothetical protein PENTCL1PPCAC_5894, partial [Pristionchus entomophagus]